MLKLIIFFFYLNHFHYIKAQLTTIKESVINQILNDGNHHIKS